jgi:hypothetical protein
LLLGPRHAGSFEEAGRCLASFAASESVLQPFELGINVWRATELLCLACSRGEPGDPARNPRS